MNSANSSVINQKPELLFALVGAAGTRLDILENELRQRLSNLGYETVRIHLSNLLEHFIGGTAQTGTSEFDRITHRQDMGNAFRKQLKRGDALALAGIKEIREERAKRPNSKGQDDPAPACAYILKQLKHPAEVDLLRKVYGPSFFLIAGHAPHNFCKNNLSEKMSQSEADKVIERDEKEDDDFGQNVRDTYPKADFFVDMGTPSGEWEVGKFVDLLFGHPFRTPSPDEYAMYLASAVSLRSSDKNRQVGAIIVNNRANEGNNKSADIIAVGMNEVPNAPGGYPWDQKSPDYREQSMKEDRARKIKVDALAELIEKIKQQKWLTDVISSKPGTDLASELMQNQNLKGTQFMDIGEFSRPVHAEMAALIDAARRGVAVDSHSMYVTTFPCHNCAKHIIAAGIRRIIYLEPYPKSRTKYLYGEEINLEALPGKEDYRVSFYPFTGIAPRQYQQLFSMTKRGGKENSMERWTTAQQLRSLVPLYVPQNASLLYLEAERQALYNLPSEVYSLNNG